MCRGCGTDGEKKVEYRVLLCKPEGKRHNLIDGGVDGIIVLMDLGRGLVALESG
jgi:hypothetical protein